MNIQIKALPFSLAVITSVLLAVFCSKQDKVTEKISEAKVVQSQAVPESTSQPKPQVAAPAPKKNIESIASLDDLNALLDGTPGKLLVFDLYADWCKPCRMLSPVFTSLADKHGKNARFFRIDVQNNPDIAQAFGVSGIPYVVFIKDKKVVHALTGLNPAESYEKVITTCGSAVSVEECQEKLNSSL